MENKKVFNKNLKESSKIRYEINEVWRAKHLNVLSSTFKRIFKRSTTDFKVVKDAIHYKGGYPLECSPPKMNELLDGFAAVIKFYDLMEKDNARNYLKNCHGIEVIDNDPLKDTKITKYKADPELAKMIPELVTFGKPVSTKIAAKLIFKKADEIQGIICGLSDKIKYDAATEVETACKIKKSDFKKAVQLEYKAIKTDNSVDSDVTKITESREIAKEAFELIKKKNENRKEKMIKKKIDLSKISI